jgi:hypothetical protein
MYQMKNMNQIKKHPNFEADFNVYMEVGKVWYVPIL